MYEACDTAWHKLRKGYFRGRTRCDQQLIKGAHLALAGDREARDYKSQHEGKDAYEVGQKKPLKFQVRVEPVAYHNARSCPLGQKRTCYVRYIVAGDLGCVGSSPVKKDLHAGIPSCLKIP